MEPQYTGATITRSAIPIFPRKSGIGIPNQVHDLSTSAYRDNAKYFPEDRARQIGRIEKKTTCVSSALSGVYLDAKISLAVDPEAGMLETWEAWVATMQVADALFLASTIPRGTEVECMIDHEVRKLNGIGPRYFTNASNWTTAFFLAVTCRESERVRRLCEIPVELLREAGESKGTEYNEYTYHWIAALQAFVLERPGLVRHLTKAIELSDPDSGAFGGDALDKLVFPQMNTFRCLLEEDSDGFNKALAQGLQLFKGYYTADEERAKDIKGVVPLGLLAMACWARDKQQHRPELRLEVESGYLPRYILDGGWVGEFPT
ncbi:hypothetical protein HNR06_001603 [Nocardiopsis arvandica]|uniref:Immunity 49 family protein n=1 Tax=Nocardiopsis sinuspersici TaxID=501010 RepID=A0A7Y9XA41_9ACTN|nr:immunity 49 family protein [Nocardiopsis sinuspersici]NYH52014.1 hypothetical protein [Nocardiopsis sinuspersici]